MQINNLLYATEAWFKLSGDYLEAILGINFFETTTEYQISTTANSSTPENQDNTTLSSRKKRSLGNFSFSIKDLMVGFFLWLS